MKLRNICSVSSCRRDVSAKGKCKPHYERQRRGTLNLNSPVRIKDGDRGCAQPGCMLPHKAKGYCNVHHCRIKYGTNMEKPVRWRDGTQGCRITGCNNRHGQRGFCNSHYNRVCRIARKKKLTEQFGNICADCLQTFPPVIFDFDNINPDRKHTSITILLTKNASDGEIQEELKYCEMVCANCHRLRTHARYSTLEMQ